MSAPGGGYTPEQMALAKKLRDVYRSSGTLHAQAGNKTTSAAPTATRTASSNSTASARAPAPTAPRTAGVASSSTSGANPLASNRSNGPYSSNVRVLPASTVRSGSGLVRPLSTQATSPNPPVLATSAHKAAPAAALPGAGTAALPGVGAAALPGVSTSQIPATSVPTSTMPPIRSTSSAAPGFTAPHYLVKAAAQAAASTVPQSTVPAVKHGYGVSSSTSGNLSTHAAGTSIKPALSSQPTQSVPIFQFDKPSQNIPSTQPPQPGQHAQTSQFFQASQPTQTAQPFQSSLFQHAKPVQIFQHVQPLQNAQAAQLIQPFQFDQHAQSAQHVQAAQNIEHFPVWNSSQPTSSTQQAPATQTAQTTQFAHPSGTSESSSTANKKFELDEDWKPTIQFYSEEPAAKVNLGQSPEPRHFKDQTPLSGLNPNQAENKATPNLSSAVRGSGEPMDIPDSTGLLAKAPAAVREAIDINKSGKPIKWNWLTEAPVAREVTEEELKMPESQPEIDPFVQLRTRPPLMRAPGLEGESGSMDVDSARAKQPPPRRVYGLNASRHNT